MVFSTLQNHEKEAFFSLLDEYFASRPELLGNVNGSSDPSAQASAAGSLATSAVHRALANNPEATSKLVSAGLKHGVPKSSPYSAAASDPHVSDAVGRVAAASLAFGSSTPPPARSVGTSNAKPSAASSLFSQQRIGGIDTSSAKNAMFSSFGSKKNDTPALPPPAPAFSRKPSGFAPPPRHGATPSLPVRQPEPEPEPEPEEAGEWAEALYDYSADDPADISLKEGQRVLVTDRSDDDWWKGEVNMRSGSFPAAYVKLL
ncbi:hypothetical protein BDN72DRAFT_50349 [Pluteus cervinus]|uniref:Uncharacterized protein n=1 Tax=Pluteus cervinus TaxID=181527 RepID=A0ACD3B9Y0_9AGAR|nr:hypothetical protein BDN72DRAFT_50349 [Pluteus cervinus]